MLFNQALRDPAADEKEGVFVLLSGLDLHAAHPVQEALILELILKKKPGLLI